MPDSPDAPNAPDSPDAPDDTLARYDLRAWEPPPPPPGLAAAVVARMTTPVAAHASAGARSPRLVVAAAVATLLAIAAVTVVVVTHGAPGGDPAPSDVAMTSPPARAEHPTALPAGGGGDSDAAKTRELEERVRRLEDRLAELEAENRALRGPAPRTAVPPVPPPVVAVTPPVPTPCVPDPMGGCLRTFVPDPPAPAPVPVDPDGMVDPFSSVRPRSCNFDRLLAQGVQHLSEAADGAALASLEAALRCRPNDLRATRLAYMAACDASDATRAGEYFQQLARPDQTTLLQICVRNGIDPRAATPAVTGPGKLVITAKPPARVFIDGVDTGKTTPEVFVLPAGRHKFTLELGGDKYTYPVTIRTGETVKLTKDLQ